jgi:hypothetical protein
MRIMTVTLALGTALALCVAVPASSKAEVRKPLRSPVRVPVVMSDPYWIRDYNIAKPVARVDHLEYGLLGIGQ